MTFNTGNDTVLYWTPDGRRIIFATQRGRGVGQSAPQRLGGGRDAGTTTHGHRHAGMLRQDGSAVAFTRMGGAYWRKGYRGNRADDIWIQDLATRAITQLTDTNLQEFRAHTQDVYPMWGADGIIYFASERDGIFNIWRIPATGGQAGQVTFHKADGVQFPSMSPDGRTSPTRTSSSCGHSPCPAAPRRRSPSTSRSIRRRTDGVRDARSNAEGSRPRPRAITSPSTTAARSSSSPRTRRLARKHT